MSGEGLTLLNLIPFSEIAKNHIKSTDQLKRVLIAGARKRINFFAANQTDKTVILIQWGFEEIEDADSPKAHSSKHLLERRFYERKETRIFSKGQMLPITRLQQFDMLFKDVLNEKDLFVDLDGFDELIEYQQNNRLFELNAQDSTLTPPSEFRDISYKQIYLRSGDLEAISDIVRKGTKRKKSKQEQREEVFLSWLSDKDYFEVSLMKTADIWRELQKLDHKLFSVEPENFFKKQDTIKFKPGRKSS